MLKSLYLYAVRTFLLSALCCLLVQISFNSFSQESTFEVKASGLNQPTGIMVTKGETYQIMATGEWQDADFPPTDANGFKGFTAPMFFGMLLKPMPSQYYMKLCGKVGNWKFPIGISTTVEMKRTGELYLFPNDAKGFFDNNNGSIKVTVLKVSPNTR